MTDFFADSTAAGDRNFSVSDSAVKRIAWLVEQEQGDGLFLRVTVSGGGCSGFQYGYTFDDEIRAEDQVFERDGVKVRVIAGESMGKGAVIETRTPIMYLHFILQPGATHVQRVPSEYNAFAYLVEGKGSFGSDAEEGEKGDLIAFEQDGGRVSVTNTGDEPLSFLLLGGLPLNEPVARYGPFVMNTREEIMQAFEDYRAGKMGLIDP